MPSIALALRRTVSAGLLCAAGAAQAQDFDAVRLDDLGGAEGRGRAGAALIVTPQYRGSDERRTLLLPLVEYQWKSGWFAGVTNGVGYAFESGRDQHWGLRLTVDPGRRESRSTALAGMGNVSLRPEVGAFYGTTLTRGQPGLALDASVRATVGDGRALADLGVGYGFTLMPTLLLRLRAAVTLANGTYMQDYFGVTDEQAGRTGYAPFKASAGLRDVRAGATLLYAIDRSMALSGTLGVNSLRGDAAQSPLTRDTSAISAVAAFSIAF